MLRRGKQKHMKADHLKNFLVLNFVSIFESCLKTGVKPLSAAVCGLQPSLVGYTVHYSGITHHTTW